MRILTAVLFVVLGAAQASADTILYYTSTPGSWVGAGRTVSITPRTNFGFDFRATVTLPNAVHFFIDDFATNPNFLDAQWWFLDLAAPLGQPLAPGLWLDATRFPFQDPQHPGISFGGNGRANNMQTGYFRILESQIGPDGTLLHFAADFLQFDELQTVNYTWGSIRIDSDFAITESPVFNPIPQPPGAVLMGVGLCAVWLKRAWRYSRLRATVMDSSRLNHDQGPKPCRPAELANGGWPTSPRSPAAF